ncbi:MAG: hypothetical protein A3F84_20630 [Candidatus Handelsmanbacteria bacterium RIFCSPLOWO2_12_FULL_64_10]|uniref:Peptidase M14 domain-containing protein n=1 Tax=Handelsmanbacteria sp. (strain RIFCSPLOWO2_12_FULL_64_10) TaxID=1817868 RepID=A0A1F6D2B3_HANXR|nr:MAG: hypothetical protein A3F84_20630 [Candidatus Handelsmanbacteria bacterium RIFCSPLOWO2_12_FULL_64_10]
MRKPIFGARAIAVDGSVELSWLKSTPMFQANDDDEFARVRVFRREEPFVFGEDYEEFFLNTEVSGADLLFEGRIEASNRRKYVFRDPSAAPGRTYTYWIQTRNSVPVGPIPVRVRDPEVWWSYRELTRRLEVLRGQAPDLVELSVCGQTTRGLDIPCVRVGKGKLAMGLVGAIHGGESGPELILPALTRLVEERPDLFRTVRVVALPSVNIDAREDQVRGVPWYIRTNPSGVDLNRNFPALWDQVEYGYGFSTSEPGSLTYRGPAPMSAPETKAVVSVFSGELPRVVFSYHALASICGPPALAASSGEGSDAYVRRCRRLVDIFGKAFYPEPQFAGKWLGFGCCAGSLPAWLIERGQVPAFDLECGFDADALRICRRDETDLPLLKNYQSRHFEGLKAVLEALAPETD